MAMFYDRITQFNNRYRLVQNSDGTYTLNKVEGTVYQEGTKLDAINLNLVLNSIIPTGAIMEYAGDTAPSGFLFCRGQAISRTTYKALYDVIGTTYGSGNGTDTFNLPDLQGKVPVGYKEGDTNFGTLGGSTGNTTSSHNHAAGTLVADIGAVDSNLGAIGYNATGTTKSKYNRGITGSAIGDIESKKANHSTTVSGNTADGSTSTLQPSTTTNFIIKYKTCNYTEFLESESTQTLLTNLLNANAEAEDNISAVNEANETATTGVTLLNNLTDSINQVKEDMQTQTNAITEANEQNNATVATVTEQSNAIQTLAAENQDKIDKATIATQDQIVSINSSLEEKMNKTDLIESTQLAESTLNLIGGNLGYVLSTTNDNSIKSGSDTGTGFVADTTGKFLCTENLISNDSEKISLRTNKTNLRYLLVSYDSSNVATIGSWTAFENGQVVKLPDNCVKFRLTFCNSDATELNGDEDVTIVHGMTLFQTEVNDNSITYVKLNEDAIDKIVSKSAEKVYKNEEVIISSYSYPDNGISIGMDIAGSVQPPSVTNISVVSENKLDISNKILIQTSFDAKIIVYSYKNDEGLGYVTWVNYSEGDEIAYKEGATHVRITVAKQSGETISNEDTILIKEYLSPSVKNKTSITVDINGNGDYKSVVTAVNNEAENTVINIMQGDYYGTIEAFQKEIILKGVDRNKCRLISTNGLYAYPPLNGSCGWFENLTFYHMKTDASADTTNVAGGYAVHVESDYSANKKMTFLNCDFISDFYPAFGVGLRPNFTLEFINCKFYTTAETMYSSLGTNGYLGAVYFHDSNTTYRGANQNIIFRNCEIIAKGKYALVPYSMNTNNEMTAYFVNTLLYSETNGKTNIIFHRVAPESGMWSGKCCKLDVKSYGNNISDLNA